MLIYALQSFTATDGTVCTAKSTFTVTDAAGQTAIMRGQAQLASMPAYEWGTYSTGNRDVKGWDAASGAYVGVGGTTSLLSVTTIRMAANTAGLATATDIPFDTVLRDDLGLATGMTAGRIRIPSNCTQFRLSYSVGVIPVAGGSYRRIQAGIYTANDSAAGIATSNNMTTLGIRANVREVPSAGMITAAQQNDMFQCTHLIDCSTLTTPLSTNPAYADNQYIKVALTHDIGSALQIIGAGSSLTLECYTPA